MAKSPYLRNLHQKQIAKLLNGLCYSRTRWEVWQDFIEMAGLSLANAFPGPYREQREKTYLARAEKYKAAERDVIAQMLAEVVMAFEDDPDQDFLGELFMVLELSNEWKGQFFTPYNVCRAMAKLSFTEILQSEVEKRGWVSVNDPACGAGALLIAAANEAQRLGINYQTDMLFVAQDIDYLAGLMCYIQMSVLGFAGYVVIADTISNPSLSVDRRGLIPVDGPNVWYTPMYHRDIWQWRVTASRLDTMIASIERQEKPVSEKKPVPRSAPKRVPLAEAKGGQLSLF